MKKITFSFKSLLVAAGLLIGSANAWADDVYDVVYTRAAVEDWQEADGTAWGTSVDASNGLGVQGNTTFTATQSFSITENSKVKYDLDWVMGSSVANDANFTWIQFGEKIRLSWGNAYKLYVTTDGTSSTSGTNTWTGANSVYTKHITIIINTATKKVESFTFDGNDYSSYVTGVIAGDFDKVSFGFIGEKTVKWSVPSFIKTITVSECKQAVSMASYTINYKLGDNVVKTVSSSSTVGAEIIADAAIDGEDEYEGNHYLATAVSAPSMVLTDGENVLDVPVRAPYTATLNVTTTIGTNDPQVAVTNLVESDAKDCSWSYAYPLYVKSGDVYYKADNTTTFGEGGTFTDREVINKTVTYSTADADVVFFAEAESKAGSNYIYSNGNSGNIASQNARDRGTSVGSLDAGVYEFVVNITAANRRTVVVRQGTNDPLASVGTSKEDLTTGIKSAFFTLDAETENLYVNGANSGDAKTNQSEDFDYVLIKKLPSTASATITSAGWATLYTPYALNFSGVAGLTAYTATCDGSTVTLTDVENVPANTGVVLKGDANTYSIPVIASSETAPGALKGSATEATAYNAITNTTLYILTKEDGGVQFNPMTSGELAAGKAYLPLTTTGAKLRVVFAGDDATAIKAIATEADEDDAIYNVAGQRVNAAYKGIIIKNGKKYINK